MIKNYINIAFRNTFRNKLYSSINIIGLAIGLAAALTMMLYVVKEYSYDRFNKNADHIVKVDLKDNPMSPMSYRFAEALKEAAPEIVDFARIHETSAASTLIESDAGKKFFEPGIVFGDSGVFRVFSFEFLRGNPLRVLDRPGTVVLTERMAKKYFGDQDPIGRVLTYNKSQKLEVSAVIADIPTNSSLKFDFIADLHTIRSIEGTFFNSIMPSAVAEKEMEGVGATGAYQTYFLLQPETSVAGLENKIPGILTSGIPDPDKAFPYYMIPLTDIHFKLVSPQSLRNVQIFSLITLLILLLAIVNYVNLSTARAIQRFKEVAMRKIAGASRKSLILQFYMESFVQVTTAFVAGLATLMVLQYFMLDLFNFEVDSTLLGSNIFIFSVLGVYLSTIFLAGLYPALLLSGYEPLKSMKAGSIANSNAMLLRKLLTGIQYSVSLILIIAFFVINGQLNLMMEKDLGLDRNRLISVQLDQTDGQDMHYSAIKSGIRNINGVEKVAASVLPMYSRYFSSVTAKSVLDTNRKSKDTKLFRVDSQFVSAMSLNWIIPPAKGAAFRESDVVLNETAAKLLGVSTGQSGDFIDMGMGLNHKLIGVVKDYNYTSLAEKISPMVLLIENENTYQANLYIKLSDNSSITSTIASIQKVYDRYKSDRPFSYSFVDSNYRKLYNEEIAVNKIIGLFMGLALLIASSGLFGLAAFTASQRTREIGIRKVLGASVSSILTMLSKDFLKLISIALIVSSPLAYLIMQKWLDNYAYRIEFGWWIFASAGIIVLLVSLIVISFQTVKAAVANPADSLRRE